jgi:ATP-dependent Lon protease
MPTDKNARVKKKTNEIVNDSSGFSSNVNVMLLNFRSIVVKTIISLQTYKNYHVMTANDLKQALELLHRVYSQIDKLDASVKDSVISKDNVVKDLQSITNDLSAVFKCYGTNNVIDLLNICLGKDYINKEIENGYNNERFKLLERYAHPIGYKSITWKNEPPKEVVSIKKTRIVEDISIADGAQTLEAFDLARTVKGFYMKVYGIKVAFRQPNERKTLIVNFLIDDVMLECAGSAFVNKRLLRLHAEKNPSDNDVNRQTFARFLGCLTIKDLIVYSDDELVDRYIGYCNQVSLIKQKAITQVTKEFLGNELYLQRNTLMQLLLHSDEHEYQYLAYLLYDLLSNDSNGSVDTHEQTLLFDSLPWNVKKYFRDAMKKTINYTNNLSSFDNAKIPLEQHICLMKADEYVKEKAMLKLKEVKSKSDDSGSKARQYLEGLLRVPFGIYRNEPILSVISDSTSEFKTIIEKITEAGCPVSCFPVKDSYNGLEVRKYSCSLVNTYVPNLKSKYSQKICNALTKCKRNSIIANVCHINTYIKTHDINHPKLLHSGKKISYMQNRISEFVDKFSNKPCILSDVAELCGQKQEICEFIHTVEKSLNTISKNLSNITDYMGDVHSTLNKAVHGHDNAKRQVERIIGQWISGERTGYCFGFEGPPGVGKTSLAKKGIASCLKDNDGSSRPFAFIAVGGSSNASTLDGHNYTYVGSTWGRIADILMETKCMNPIIFIDELDKVSRTEHGKEIIGILTHLIDPTQNDSFQDKYFTGIDLDLSKALFVFSYNDVDAIDRILLDRIHRVKFDHLTLEDKLTITNEYLFPEIYSKMGLQGVVDISNEVVEYLIEEYTCEPGVRKLKEILFEIVGEINLSVLQEKAEYDIPIQVSIEDVRSKYLKDRHEFRAKKINTEPQVGLISGLWANALGKGGVLPIEVSFCPSPNFLDLKLTGMQGDVMKESMNVAKTLACSLAERYLGSKNMGALLKKCEESKMQGIHIHVPEGATPKDGPSAGTAITVTLYSLLMNKKIKHDVAITGEMCLQGKVTAIGGLDIKILGGIRAGVKTFIYPKENDKDFNDFMEKYKDNPCIEGISFVEVSTIDEVLEIVFA